MEGDRGRREDSTSIRAGSSPAFVEGDRGRCGGPGDAAPPRLSVADDVCWSPEVVLKVLPESNFKGPQPLGNLEKDV